MIDNWSAATIITALAGAACHFCWHFGKHQKPADSIHVVNSALYLAGLVQSMHLTALMLLSDKPVDLRQFIVEAIVAIIAVTLVSVNGLIENLARIRNKRLGSPPAN
jgi:uncharacterized membrane protein